MLFTKNTTGGVFPGISVQLFDCDTPVSEVATIACHSLPASWGAYHLPNATGTRTMIIRLEESPFASPSCGNDQHREDDVEDTEEYRPLDGDVWVFPGSPEAMWGLVKTHSNSFIDSLVYHKLDQSKKFSDSILELHVKGDY